jgi:hypothetical protein
MNSTADTKALKILSYDAIFDKRSPTSGRVASAIIYVVLRAGDVIDWLFPLKVAESVKSQ